MTTTPALPGTSPQYTAGRPLRRYALWFGVASLGVATVWGGVIGVLLANQVQVLEFARWFTGADAGVDLRELADLKAAGAATAEQQRLLDLYAGFDAARAQSLSWVTAGGLVLSMLLSPVIGVLSDRTRSRYGRRAPWILFGGMLGALLLIGMRYAPTVAVLALLWACTQLALNAALGPLNTTTADRVPPEGRGTVSAVGGLGTFAGGIGGGVLAGAAFAALGLDLYFVFAGAVLLGLLAFVLLLRDRPSTELAVPEHRWGEFFRGFGVPLRSPDFRWVWTARVLLAFGYAASTALGLYMLQGYITPALSAAEATAIFPLLAVVGAPGTLVSLVVFGRLSDRIGRRKPFVVLASALMAVSMAVPLLWPTLPALIVQGVLAGIAFGAYLPVDQALFIDVLPDPNSAGRDLGIATLGNNVGQALGPILAGQIVALTGGYQLVWATALVLVAVAGVAILPVKAVR